MRYITTLLLSLSVAGCGARGVVETSAPPTEQASVNMDAVEYDSTCCVFFPRGTATVGDVLKKLGDYSVTVKRDDDTLYVKGVAQCQFKIELVTDPHVLEEAIEIATGSPHEQKMKICDARFEIAIENLDIALDESNTLMEIQTAVQDATQGLLFLPWNGEVTEPLSE